MRTQRFYKNEYGWFIDLKWFPFNKVWLAMIEGADKLLDKLANGKDEIFLQLDTRPFPYSDGWLEKDWTIGTFKGAIYNAKGIEIDNHFPFSGKETSQLWLCPATLWVYLKYPKKIYYKVVE